MNDREHRRQLEEEKRRLEDAIETAAAACLKQNPVEAFKALAPFCSEDVVAKPPDAQIGDKTGGTPADGTKVPATGATPGTGVPAADQTRRRNRPGRASRRRSLF